MMKRLFVAASMAVFAYGAGVLNASSQTTGNWTLNITNPNGAAAIPAGGEIPYGIRITNDGNYNTPAGKIAFTIPATTIYRGVDGLVCSPEPDGSVLTEPLPVTCDVPVLTPAQNLTATVNVSPMQGDCGGVNCVIDFSGRVYNPEGSPPAEAVRSVGATITVGADLELQIDLDEDTVRSGSHVHFEATVANNGPDASTSSQVVIPLPTGMSSPQLPPECTLSSGNIICTVPNTLAAGEYYTFDLSAQVTVGTASIISIAGRVEGGTPRDAVQDNDNDSADLEVIPGTDVRLGKSRSPGGLLLLGDEVTFTLTPDYVGTAPQTAQIIDTIPNNYNISDLAAIQAPAGWSCGLVGRTVTCDYIAGPGASYASPITIDVSAAVVTVGETGVVNTAVISSVNENEDAPKDNNTAKDLTADIKAPFNDLAAYKSGPARGLVTVGNTYDYTLRAKNKGNKPFNQAMTITDFLPEGLQVTAIEADGWICSPSAPIAGSAEIVCTTNKYETTALPVGGFTDTIKLTTKVTKAGEFSNSMLVSFPRYDEAGFVGKDNNITDNRASSGTTISADGENWANIGVVKSVSPTTPVLSGDEVTFTIKLHNDGPTAATRVRVTDRLSDIVGTVTGGAPSNIAPVISGATGSCSVANDPSNFGADLDCLIDTLPICVQGSGGCPEIRVTVRAGSEGLKTNTVNAYSLDVPDNDLLDNQSSVNYTVLPRTDVSITKSSPASATGAAAGQEITYILAASVPNNGLSAAENVTITDTLPAGVIFVRAEPSGGVCETLPPVGVPLTDSNNKIICNLGAVATNSQKTLKVFVVPVTQDVGARILNVATVSTTTQENRTDNNRAELPIDVLAPRLDLAIAKTDDPIDPVEIATNVVYTISLENTGPSDAFNVVITDKLPSDGFTNPVVLNPSTGLICTLHGVSTTAAGGEIVCKLPRLKASSNVSFQVQMKSFKKGVWENTVSVSSDETVAGYEKPVANNTATEDTTVRTRADISVVKTPSVRDVDLRKEFYWDLVITNIRGPGLDVAEEVTLADTLPNGMMLTKVPEIIVGAGAARSCTGAIDQSQINCEFGEMAIGEKITVRFHAKITSMDVQAASNTATVSTKSFDKNLGNNTSTGRVSTVLGSTVSGAVFKDYNNDGVINQLDAGIGALQVTITGTATHDGSDVNITMPTNADGTYSFKDLPPGTYTVSYAISKPADYSDVAGEGKSYPGANPAENGTAVSNGKTVIQDIVTTGKYDHVKNDFTLVPLPKIGLGKTVAASAIQADGSYSLNYTINVKNHSGEPLSSVDLIDVMSGATQNFGTAVAPAATLAPGQYKVLNIVGTGITANPNFDGSAASQLVIGGKLGIGITAKITFTVKVQPLVPWKGSSTTHINQAEVSGVGDYTKKTTTDKSHNTTSGHENPANNTQTTVKVTPKPAIKLGKTTTSTATDVGDVITYSFTITNTGNVPLVNVSLEDLLPGLVGPTTVLIDRLDPGNSNTDAITATYTLTQADLDRGFVTNNAKTVGQWGENSGTPLAVESKAAVTVDSLARPELEIIKDIDEAVTTVQDPTVAGDNIRYKLTVTNTGNTTLTGVVIKDELAGILPSPAGAFTIGNMPRNGAPVVVYADYKVTAADINNGKVDNTASASGKHGDNKPVDSNKDSETVPLHQNAELALAKALDGQPPTTPLAGNTLTWKVTARNTGNVTLYNVKVNDPLAGATIAPASVASLQPGAEAIFAVTAPIQQEWINAGNVTNIAKANFDSPKGEEPEVPSNQVEVPLNQVPNIALKKTGDLSDLPVGTNPAKDDVVHYTFTIRNTGNVPLIGVTLTDELNIAEDKIVVTLDPQDMLALAAKTLQPLNSSGSNLADAQAIVRGTYILTQDDIDLGSISNLAKTTGIPPSGEEVEDTSGTDFENDNPTVNILTRAPLISLEKTISGDLSAMLVAGDEITYAFKIVNTGNITIENIRIEDVVGGVTVANPTGWNGPMVPGEENIDAFVATYTLKQEDIELGTFTNTAKVFGTSSGGAANDVTDDSTAVLSIDQTPGISIVKTADKARIEKAKIGDEITYTFVVTNTGNVTLSNVVVTDPLIAEAMWIDDPEIGDLLPGEAHKVTLTAKYAVTQNDIQAGKVDNTATVNADDDGEPLEPESSDATVELEQLPSIAVIKELDTENTTLEVPAEPGQIIAYKFIVKNTGNMILTDIELDDPLEGIVLAATTVGELMPGATWETTATYVIDDDDIDAGEVENQAIATGTYDDEGSKTVNDPSGPDFETDKPVVVPVIPPAPVLTLVKTGEWLDENGNGYPEVGELIKYTFTVTNDGNTTVRNVTPVDAGPMFGGQPLANKLSAFSPDPVTLEPEGSQEFTATYALSQEDIDATAGIVEAITNTAVAIGTFRSNDRPYTSNEDNAVVTLPATEPTDVIITKQAILHQVRRGDRVPYIIKVENTSSSNAGPVNVIDTMPSGFRFVEDSATVDGTAITPVVNGRKVMFENLQLLPHSKIEIRLDLLVLSTAGPGKHTNIASVTDRSGTPIAKDAHATVEIVAEPVFDCGDIVGTVFDDVNGNGYQDAGEPGLPGVRVATVKGWLVTTDQHGRFHVACAALPDQRIGSNFIMKLDTRTLPTGYRVTTENPRVVRLTAGKMTKLNFGASISRVVRIDLQNGAFRDQSVELQPQWETNLDPLIQILREERSVLRLSYTGSQGEDDLAAKRMLHMRERIADLWKKNGASYQLEIETRVEVGQ